MRIALLTLALVAAAGSAQAGVFNKPVPVAPAKPVVAPAAAVVPPAAAPAVVAPAAVPAKAAPAVPVASDVDIDEATPAVLTKRKAPVPKPAAKPKATVTVSQASLSYMSNITAALGKQEQH